MQRKKLELFSCSERRVVSFRDQARHRPLRAASRFPYMYLSLPRLELVEVRLLRLLGLGLGLRVRVRAAVRVRAKG